MAASATESGGPAMSRSARARWSGDGLESWTSGRPEFAPSTRVVRDTLWGNQSGDLTVMSVTGESPRLGPVALELGPDAFELIVRDRQASRTDRAWLEWESGAGSRDSVALQPKVRESDGWVVASAVVPASNEGTRTVRLTVRFDGQTQEVLDVAFITVVQ